MVRQDRGGFPDTVTRFTLDERRDDTMAFPSRGPGQRPVRDLACEHMFEDELSIVGHARGRSPSDEVSPLQIVQDVVEIALIALKLRDRTSPEDATDHGRILEHLSVLTGERVGRAAMIACTVVGSPATMSAVRSLMDAASSSRNSGLPPLVADEDDSA